jgi:UTP--glucose-1-phosphate uridylyltransferase
MTKLPINLQDASVAAKFRAFELKMEAHSLRPMVINIFKHYYTKLLQGDLGKMPEAAIAPVSEESLKSYAALEPYAEDGIRAMNQAVVIKLNGGLGTSMGLERAKSLITLKDGLTFLDIILRQVLHLRGHFNTHLPLVLMNSFKTHVDTMLHVEHFDNAPTGIPLAFVQNRFPKVLQDDFSPACWPDNPELEWNPPGHGDIYTALKVSGLLDNLLRKGFVYAFISNSDNLGAVMDPRILGYLAKERLPFLMEVARRTPSDRKGGHLAVLRAWNRLCLREIAQCPDKDLPSFEDIDKHRYFNTNSLWIDLRSLEQVFLQHHMIPLDLILNPKTLDPRNHNSPRVLQIETAMGAAVSAFQEATAVEVPRERFAPVKTTNDLLLVQSDCYLRNEDETLTPAPECATALPAIQLDAGFYKKIDDFQQRFPHGPPSLLRCRSLTVNGDVLFGKGVTCVGAVDVTAPRQYPARVEEHAILQGEVSLQAASTGADRQ